MSIRRTDLGDFRVVDPAKGLFICGSEPSSGDLVFITWDAANRWAPFFAASCVAGTWGRFIEMTDDLAEDLREQLAGIACYPDFESFRDGELNESAWQPDACDEEEIAAMRATMSEPELREAYAGLGVPHGRGPIDSDAVDIGELYTFEQEGQLRLYCPFLLENCEVPEVIEMTYGYEYRDLWGNGPYLTFPRKDRDEILAAFARQGLRVVEDEFIFGCFCGDCADVEAVHQRLDAILAGEEALRKAAAGAEGGGDDDDDDDSDD